MPRPGCHASDWRGEAAQVGQGAVAGADVIEREADAAVPQRPQCLQRVRLVQDRGFGHLEDESIDRGAQLAQRPGDPVRAWKQAQHL